MIARIPANRYEDSRRWRRVPRLARGRTIWAVPLLVFLAILLVAGLAFNLAHLDTGGDILPTVPNAGGTDGAFSGLRAFSLLQTAVVFGFFGFLVLGLVLYARRRRGKRAEAPGPASIWDAVASFVVLGVFLLMIYLWPLFTGRATDRTNDTTGGSGAGGATGGIPTVSGIPAGYFLGAALLAALLVLTLLFRPTLRLGGRGLAGASEVGRAQAAAAVAVALKDLEVGDDVRETILACFRRFCEILGTRGLTSQDPLTPRELEDLAVGRFRVPEAAASDLTSLFEEARYSEHPLGEPDRDRAVRSLQGIQAFLGG